MKPAMKKTVLAALFAGTVLAQAHAQQPGPQGAPPPMTPDMATMMHLAAHNQLGVLEYCQANHFVGPDVVAMERQQLNNLPPAQVQGELQAEAEGRQGVVAAGGRRVTLAQAAQTQSTDVGQLCQRIGDMARQQAAEASQPGQ